MKLSQLSNAQISALSNEQLSHIVYDGIADTGECADVALLLGTDPVHNCKGRALWAAQVYKAGRVNYVIPTGGVTHDFAEGRCTEAEYMQNVLLDAGVPADAVILENEARTTKENMVCGTFQIARKLLIQNVKSVMIVSAKAHMRRSLALAAILLPRHVRICASFCPDTPEGVQWWEDDAVRQDVIREAQLIADLIRQGLMEEIVC